MEHVKDMSRYLLEVGTLKEHIAAMEKFINAVTTNDEEMPSSFERVQLREVEI